MHTSSALAILLAIHCHSLPLIDTARSLLHQRSPAPTCPVSVQSADYLCDVKSSNTDTVRDLGYVGSVGGKTIHTYGDTLAAPGASFWMTSDSSAMGTSDPCKIFDAALEDGDHPKQFVPTESQYGETNTADAMGITNVIETGSDTGMVFFLKNHRQLGGTQYIVGAGVADVTISGDIPSATRTAEYWWDAQKGEPYYGDVTAYGGAEFVWGLGHGNGGHYTYMTRAPKVSYHDLSTWEYWDGSISKWTSNRLYNPTAEQALQWNDEDGAVWGVGQGQMIWSNYYNKIMFVYAMSWAGPDGQTAIMARTADRPCGPWSKAETLFSVSPVKSGGLVYAPIPNPYFDESGKTMIVTVTNADNVLQATRVTFN